MVLSGQREIALQSTAQTHKHDSDEALVAKAKALRDTESFGLLVDRHQSRVRAYLRQVTREPALADDLAQETFIRAWNKLASFTGKGSFASWLMAIAHNQFLQAIRKSKRERRLMDDLKIEKGEPAMQLDASSSPTSGELPDLPKLLAVLTEQEQTVMLLGYGFGFSHAEITKVTGMALGTVKSHIYRGKARIRDKFGLEESDDA